MTEPFRLIQHGDTVSGPMRHPRNLHQGAPNSIHNDAVASKLGMRGGTVAGNYHMDQFPPLLTTLYGRRWWQSGNLSLYFRYATTDNEGVRCFAERPADPTASFARTRVWIDHENGERVAEGTAAVGAPDPDSALRQRIAATPKPRDLRILANLGVGQTAKNAKPYRVERPRYETCLEILQEPLPDYGPESAWGRPILPPSLMVDVMYSAQFSLLERNPNYGVGLFGAIELQSYDGPMYLEQDYDARIEVLALGETPKTEYFWYESIASDPKTGRDVAGMLMMLRFMKASSPLWR
jgi:hypothetical protein